MSTVFLENPPKGMRREADSPLRNGPELMLFGNPGKSRRSKSKVGGKSMAKKKGKRKGGGRRRKAVVVARPTKRRKSTKPRKTTKRRGSRRSGVTLRRVSVGKMPKSKYRIAGTVMANPLGGLIRIPSTQELMAVGIGAIALPAVNSLVKKLPLPDLMKTGWGGIATELVIGSVASVMARKFVGSAAGDVIFVLALANGVQKSVRQVSGTVADTIGLADDGTTAGSLAYYDPSQTPGVGYYEAGPGLGAQSLPEMV